TPAGRGSRAISSSASAICGTRLGLTKLVASIRRAPAAISRSIKPSFISVETVSRSLCNPSRGDTSTMSIITDDCIHFRLGQAVQGAICVNSLACVDTGSGKIAYTEVAIERRRCAVAEAKDERTGPLQDIRVVEMGQLLAGPFCGQLLADFGA